MCGAGRHSGNHKHHETARAGTSSIRTAGSSSWRRRNTTRAKLHQAARDALCPPHATWACRCSWPAGEFISLRKGIAHPGQWLCAAASSAWCIPHPQFKMQARLTCYNTLSWTWSCICICHISFPARCMIWTPVHVMSPCCICHQLWLIPCLPHLHARRGTLACKVGLCPSTRLQACSRCTCHSKPSKWRSLERWARGMQRNSSSCSHSLSCIASNY